MSRAAHDRTLNAFRASELGFVLDRNLARARNLSRNLTGDLALDRSLALDLASALDRALDRARALEVLLGLPRVLVPDLALARDLARDLARARDLAGYRDLHYALARAASGSTEVVRVLRALAPTGSASLEPVNQAIEPALWARQLAQVAARVLPMADRARYSDEYRSELYELAAAGVSQLRQLFYAARLIDQAWVLRAELRAPASRRARS